jgi:AcrR family transcriptional regulator
MMQNNVPRNPRSVQAAQRALAPREQAALEDVERILDAAVRVIERVAPASPRVSDIVAEAGTSNQTFYRYFASKDELVLAVLERGTLRLAAYLEHQMAKAPDPAGAVGQWIEGVMAQARRADANVIAEATFGALGRHIARGTRPGQREVRHLIEFCLRGVGVGMAAPVSRRRRR